MNVIRRNTIKKIGIVIGVVLLFSFTEQKERKIKYLYIPSGYFMGANLGWQAYFSMENKISKFQRDNYLFQIDPVDLDKTTLFDLGRFVNIDTINMIDPYKYYSKKSSCEVHDELSLDEEFMIVTQLPKSKKYMMWYSRYSGTVRRTVYTAMGTGFLYGK